MLYGGVSLCIYMHGTTKEVNRLVRASAAVAGADVGELQPSEAVYRELLASKAAEDGFRTDVVVDVIAGTSAGGINGVYLAKALAGDRNQDGLRDLWLNEADIGLLLRSPRWEPKWARIAKALVGLKSQSALDGDLMSTLLYRALVQMDDDSTRPGGAPRKSLIPEGSELDLLVTTTDFYGYGREIPIWDPRSVPDTQHRHVFRFLAGSSGSDLGASDSLALAFAARATSCFPAAFEPVNRPTFEQVIGGQGAIDDSLFRVYYLAGADPDRTFFIDGGVLDNRPFAPAIEAIRAKPADVDVRRTLIYLDPDPEPPPPPAPGTKPGTIEIALGAVAGLPRKQPIIDSLLEIDEMNARVAELQEVIKTGFQDVVGEVRKIVPAPLSSSPDLPEQQLRLRAAARERSQLAYPAYLRLRIEDALDRLARATFLACDYPAESTHALLVLACWRQWGAQAGLLERALKSAEARGPRLDVLNVGFGERRLRFTLAGVNWLYRRPELSSEDRARIDEVKRWLWGAILEFRGLLEHLPAELSARIRAAFPEDEIREFLASQGLRPEAWLGLARAELDGIVESLEEWLGSQLAELAARHYAELLSLGENLPADRREDILLRYVGFPLWDVQLYPLERVAEAGERDAVEVMRTSPPDATLLSREGDGPKLAGVGVHHFGAFFALAARENDYLIGRLDGAERLMRLLLGEHPARAQWSRRAFLAILDEEEPVLKTAGALIARLRGRAEEIPAGP